MNTATEKARRNENDQGQPHVQRIRMHPQASPKGDFVNKMARPNKVSLPYLSVYRGVNLYYTTAVRPLAKRPLARPVHSPSCLAIFGAVARCRRSARHASIPAAAAAARPPIAA